MSAREPNDIWAVWLAHFRANARLPVPVPEGCAPLSDAERQSIGRSIATFQLGESSDGGHLIRFAEHAAARYGAAHLPEITCRFIQEEQLHARLLGAFMDSERIPRRTRQWSDGVFRGLRRLGGFEVAVSVLVSAELIGIVYYRALSKATTSSWLHAICDRLLADEHHHVRYEAEVLRRIRQERSALGRLWGFGLHRVLFTGAVLVVLAGHHAVLRAGGLSGLAFIKACDREFRCVLARRPSLTDGSSSRLAEAS